MSDVKTDKNRLMRSDSPEAMASALKVFFSHRSPLILGVITIIFVALRIQVGNWGWRDVIAPLAIFLLWPVMEWLIHVYLLHYKPKTILGRKVDFLLPQTHRDHHKMPWDIKQVFVPLHVFPIVGPLLIVAALLIAPVRELAYGALAVYFLLALNYEFCHYLAHIRWCPPSAYYRRRVRLHRLHHFRNENLWWGVSMGMGDVLFKTAPNVEDSESSGSADDLLSNP